MKTPTPTWIGSIFSQMKKSFFAVLCKIQIHSGSAIGRGMVMPLSKRNKPLRAIPGVWLIRKCDHCNETFSNSTDQIQEKIK